MCCFYIRLQGSFAFSDDDDDSELERSGEKAGEFQAVLTVSCPNHHNTLSIALSHVCVFGMQSQLNRFETKIMDRITALIAPLEARIAAMESKLK